MSAVHTLGIDKLSRLRPQAGRPELDHARSDPWGFVANSPPQPVDSFLAHRTEVRLSTGGPQAAACCPQLRPASPHRCPLFGNRTRLFTVSSERRHTEVVRDPVGNVGKAGDDPGEKSGCPVHRLCRTFGRPQSDGVVHRRRPQDRWTKKWV
ncbi:hypothetical protein EW053_04245 [Streptomyces sp. IB2014 016-6]|nr:hypothetical protein EW053_04245 [Streptomyces sp. IB2014 016-6]